ncbi:MAG: hypothetical protein WKG01_22440 [Kofleriaceae bacterium]
MAASIAGLPAVNRKSPTAGFASNGSAIVLPGSPPRPDEFLTKFPEKRADRIRGSLSIQAAIHENRILDVTRRKLIALTGDNCVVEGAKRDLQIELVAWDLSSYPRLQPVVVED